VSGTPTATQTGTFTAEVTDADGTTTLRDVAFQVLAVPLTINGRGGLAKAALGLPYSQTLTAGNGSGTYQWEIASGSTPGGLDLSPLGVLAGIPTEVGSFTFTVRATDTGTPSPSKSAGS